MPFFPEPRGMVALFAASARGYLRAITTAFKATCCFILSANLTHHQLILPGAFSGLRARSVAPSLHVKVSYSLPSRLSS